MAGIVMTMAMRIGVCGRGRLTFARSMHFGTARCDSYASSMSRLTPSPAPNSATSRGPYDTRNRRRCSAWGSGPSLAVWVPFLRAPRYPTPKPTSKKRKSIHTGGERRAAGAGYCPLGTQRARRISLRSQMPCRGAAGSRHRCGTMRSNSTPFASGAVTSRVEVELTLELEPTGIGGRHFSGRVRPRRLPPTAGRGDRSATCGSVDRSPPSTGRDARCPGDEAGPKVSERPLANLLGRRT